jgi:TolB-like protein/DNA-binding winged helix-turn-helix (wHTH) protein/Flp pilus assembly protein TadD
LPPKRNQPVPEPLPIYRFGNFELDIASCELRRRGRSVRLERRPMDLLILLVENRRKLVSRSDIVDRLWDKDVFVDVETGINTAISKVRHALRDSAEVPSYVETVAGRGYRFIAEVELGGVPSASQARSVGDVATASRPRPRSLRHRGLAAGLLAAIVAGVLVFARLGAGKSASHVTIAVLPYENLSADPDREYVADGLAEDTIQSVGQIDPEHVSVIGRTSSLAYKHTTKSLAAIGRELNVDYLVEGSIRAEGGRLRVTSKLIRATDQIEVWSATYDREPMTLLGVQQELSAAIAEQIRLRLSPARMNQLAKRQTLNADAYDLYLRGRNFENQRTPPTTQRAIEYYERAAAADPHYALAWSGLAQALAGSAINSDAEPLIVVERTRRAAAQALAADANLAEVQTAIGTMKFFLDWDWPAAERAFRRAVALDPTDHIAFRNLGHVLSQMNRQSDAAAAVRRAREIDPLFTMNHAISSQIAFQARDYDAAINHARQAVVLDPEFWIGYVQEGQAYEQRGDAERALEAFAQAARFSDNNSKAVSLRGYALAKAGHARDAREVLRALEALSQRRYVPPYAMALVHAGLGERDAAFDWLNRAYSARDVHLIFLPVDPKWDQFRGDARFAALLERCAFTRP